MSTREAWIVDAVRTPIGRHGGGLAAVRPDDLAAVRWLTAKHGVATIPGSACGKPGYFRVCYANLPLEKTRAAAARPAAAHRLQPGGAGSAIAFNCNQIFP